MAAGLLEHGLFDRRKFLLAPGQSLDEDRQQAVHAQRPISGRLQQPQVAQPGLGVFSKQAITSSLNFLTLTKA
jgi:hypothetical protein